MAPDIIYYFLAPFIVPVPYSYSKHDNSFFPLLRPRIGQPVQAKYK